ncbi:putative gustatory receptor 2a [Sitodiplosis mosellana]|uniref:putative gustatory receptor 2a n=1 Tax=Sitodiplosis mosellana TaxID=263140 RepID=UPI002443CFF3|nr:putative gustatory receptor 2a [Sitodiplosis mosellana]
MRYQQFVAYVNLLRDRYVAINEYVSHLTLHKHEDSKYLEKPAKRYSAQNWKPSWHRITDHEPLIVMNKLKHLQRTQRLMVEANKTLRHLFSWSMLLNVANDFLNVLINFYWLILNIIDVDSKLQLIGVMSWGFFNIAMLILVSKACHFACYEGIKFSALVQSIDLANTSPELDCMALMTPALLHKINLNGCDEIFCEMILQFSSQCIHQKVNFTAFGLFSVDFSMILMITGAIITYLIFLIQFAISFMKQQNKVPA